MKTLSIALLALGALVSTGAFSQTPSMPPARAKEDGNPANKSPSGMPTDTNVMKALAAGGMAEVEVGTLATDRAIDPEVKQFAQQMVGDHSKTNEQLKSLAKEKNVELPMKPDAEHAADKLKLEQQRGASFDAEYMKTMVKNHQRTVQLLQHEINGGQDAKVKAFAQETLPTVQRHLEMAKSLEAKVAGGSTEQTSRGDKPASKSPASDR